MFRGDYGSFEAGSVVSLIEACDLLSNSFNEDMRIGDIQKILYEHLFDIENCPSCKGLGRIAKEVYCKRCAGTGYIYKDE